MFELAHTANITVHVAAGTLGLVLGFLQLAGRKGRGRHASRGRVFLWSVAVVVTTAAIGLIVFRFVAFLGVITLLVAYWAYSGYRALQIRDTGPTRGDAVVSCIGLGAAGAFIMFLQRAAFPWAPAVIYSTLASLVAVCTYDLIRLRFPARWYQTLWLSEHIVKMIGAFSALLSAFAGTVLVFWQPYSQLVPSLVCTAAMIVFVWREHAKAARQRAKVAACVHEPSSGPSLRSPA